MAKKALRLTFLVEDTVNRPGLKAEHGLAVFIDYGGRRFLFDTGQSGLLIDNARLLGVALEQLEALVLSHGHYDHTGGLGPLCGRLRRPRLFAHPQALEDKYYIAAGAAPRPIGLPVARQRLEAAFELRLGRGAEEIAPGVLTTGEVSPRHGFEAAADPFFTDPAGRHRDSVPDDLSLIIRAPGGPVLLTGCAHAGIVAIMEQAARLLGAERFGAVIGGLHLAGAGEERLRRTVEAFRRFRVERIGLAHCTGPQAAAALWQAFPGRCFLCPVGTLVEFT